MAPKKKADAGADAAVVDDTPEHKLYRVQVSKPVKVGRAWLKPGAEKILVDAPTLAVLEGKGVVETSEEVVPPVAA